MHATAFLLSLAPLVLAQYLSESDSIPATQVLADLYGTATPAGATGAVATSLASALWSYEMSLYGNKGYQSAANAVYSAAATASNSDQIFSDMEQNGAWNADFTTADWYKTGVPTDAQKTIATYWAQMSAVQTSVLGAASATATPTATSGSSSAAADSTNPSTSSSTAGAQGPMVTGKPIAGLAVGVVAGVVAML
ncbi:hypothetical protein F4779DRAFT_600102 [Xylariaceae sp. FL0662B]|nr:hypothetical protein F4779DRAFT_600102 [Xylariaceae sp. FL0662B]